MASWVPSQAANLGQRRLPTAAVAERGLAVAECLGAETLLQLLKNYSRSADRKTGITVGAARAECTDMHLAVRLVW